MKNAEDILSELDTQRLKEKLFELPDQIKAKKDELAAARQELENAKSDKTEAEAVLIATINSEIDENTGKFKYPNEKARNAELARRKKTDADYLAAEEACQNVQGTVNARQFELEKLEQQFKSYRYIVDLTAREITLFASRNGNTESDEPF